MADPLALDIIADRNVDHFENWAFLDVDWTGSTFKMQVRETRDTTGTPLLEQDTAGGSFVFGVVTATVAAHIAAGRLTEEIKDLINPATGVNYVDTDSVLLTELSLGIAAVGLEAFPTSPEVGGDFPAFYDIIRTDSGSTELIARGRFTVRAGVTIP